MIYQNFAHTFLRYVENLKSFVKHPDGSYMIFIHGDDSPYLVNNDGITKLKTEKRLR